MKPVTNRSTRRRFLAAAGSFAAAASLPAHAQKRNHAEMGTEAGMRAAIRKLTGDATIHPGRVTVDLPPLVDNGNTVPLSITVESPMSEADHVKGIHVFSEKNPEPVMVRFGLGPRAGRARVATRVRLADTQTVVAVAEMSDGSFWSGSVNVVVTISSCLEELL
jgi:sulfur-oxidizing protein SoxY